MSTSPVRRVTGRVLTAGAAFAAAALVAACSAGPATSTASGAPQPGGVLRVGLAADPVCLDPQQNGNAASINISRQVVDGLTDLDPETGEITPWLAESWEVSPDARTFTFHLREGVTFSDGTPLDAQVVKDNLDKVVTLGAATSLVTGYLKGYAGATAVDPRTVRVEFSEPNAGFLQATSVVQLGIVAPSTLQKSAEERCQAQNVIGSGPFVFDTYTQNVSTTLTKRPGYAWPSAVGEHAGEAYLDRIEFNVIAESGVRTGSLQSGQLDVITDVQPVDEQVLASGGATVLSRANPGVDNTLFAKGTSAFASDAAVRTALQKAVDRQQLASVLGASHKPATSILAATTPGYVDESVLLAADPAGAAAALDAAGWVPGPDGIRVRDGQRLALDVIYLSSVATNQTVLELLQQQLRDVGIELVLRPLSVADYVTAAKDPAVNLSFGNFTRPDLDVLRTTFSAKASNAARVDDPELEELLDGLASTADATAREALGAQAQKLILERGYGIPVYELAQVTAVAPGVDGVRYESSSRLIFFDAWKAAQ